MALLALTAAAPVPLPRWARRTMTLQKRTELVARQHAVVIAVGLVKELIG